MAHNEPPHQDLHCHSAIYFDPLLAAMDIFKSMLEEHFRHRGERLMCTQYVSCGEVRKIFIWLPHFSIMVFTLNIGIPNLLESHLGQELG